jgi:hypothetical protein
MHLSVRTVLGIAMSLSLAACSFGNYRVVKKVQNGGEVALEGMQEPAREKATAYMAEQCPSGVEIVEEGEAVVGQNASSESRPGTTLFGTKTTNTSTSTTDKREWRIKYQCKGSAPATEKASPPAGTKPSGKIHEIVIYF